MLNHSNFIVIESIFRLGKNYSEYIICTPISTIALLMGTKRYFLLIYSFIIIQSHYLQLIVRKDTSKN